MSRTSSSFSIRKGNWNNKNIFPEIIYIDTNVVLDIMEQRTYGKLAEDYLMELIRQDGMITWSGHLFDELSDFFHNQVYTIEASKRVSSSNSQSGWKWLENTATDQESSMFAQQVDNKIERVNNFLEQFGVQNDPDIKQTNDLARQIYTNYGSNLKDSKHTALANLSGTNNILTQDSGFLRFPNQNVFGSSKTLVDNSKNSSNKYNEFVDLREQFQKTDNT